MEQFFEYSRRLAGWRGSLTGLPAWALYLVAVAALPGLVLLALSAAAVLVSLATLLLLTIPVYRLLRAVTGQGMKAEAEAEVEVEVVAPADVYPSAGRKQVDAKVVE